MAAAALKARLDNLVTSMFTTVSASPRRPITCTPRPCGCSGGWLTNDQPLHQRNQEDPQRHRRNQPVVDYDMVDVLVRQLKGSSLNWYSSLSLSMMSFRDISPAPLDWSARNQGWNQCCNVSFLACSDFFVPETVSAYFV
ncbi:hypothetical protein VPH35_076069 [Triticum aestivum]